MKTGHLNGDDMCNPLGSSVSLCGGRGPLSTILSQSTASLSPSHQSLKSVASRVVALHVCQADNNITCMVPEFVHSIAAYLCAAPVLGAYKDLLLHEPHLQAALSMRHCIQDPSIAFVTGVLEPLERLAHQGKINTDLAIILVDSLNEAEFHKPDYGNTVGSFLVKHIAQFPRWLKVVTTVRTAFQDLAKRLPFHKISLDHLVANNFIHRDIMDYINYRINNTCEIRCNIAPNGRLDVSTQLKFCNHVQTLSRGCLLYCKLVLNLLERGNLVLKSSNYKILPVSLSEVFLLYFNMRFATLRSFEKLCPTLNVCLASLYPLTIEELYASVNAGRTRLYVDWSEFLQRVDLVSSFLLRRQDGTYMFFHPAFRDWLIRRDTNETNKFLCDLR